MTRSRIITFDTPRQLIRTTTIVEPTQRIRLAAPGSPQAFEPSTIDVEGRSVEAVIASDQITMSTDAHTYEPVADVLLLGRLRYRDPLIISDNHYASIIDLMPTKEALGHVRDIRDEVTKVEGQTVNLHVGRLYFDEAQNSVESFGRIRSGTIKHVSLGYEIVRGVEIGPGLEAEVDGRRFVAPSNMPLLVATEAWGTELSLTVKPADQWSRIRAAHNQSTGGRTAKTFRGADIAPGVSVPSDESPDMNPELRKYLIRCGLSETATDTEAEAYYNGLEGDQQTEAKRIRSAPPTPLNHQRPPVEGDGPVDADRIRTQERQRISQIEELAGSDTPRELVRSAIDGNWDVDRAGRAFLQAMRDRRGTDGVPGGAPAAHVRSGDGPNLRSLILSQLMGAGVQPDNELLASSRMRTALSVYDAQFLSDNARMVRTAGRFEDAYSRDVDAASELIGIDPREFCRELLRSQNIEAPRRAQQLIRTAFSSGNLDGVLDTVVYARLALAYERLPDWTRGVVAEGENNDLKPTPRVRIGANGRMVTMPRGGTPHLLGSGNEKPTVRVERKAAAAVIDELDLINGDWADLEGSMIEGLAEIATELRAEIVVSMLLQATTQKYTADNAVVASVARKNLVTSATLDSASLEAARVLLTTQTFEGRAITQVPRFLITEEAMWGDATKLIRSTEVDTSATSNAAVRSMNLQHVSDGRFDVGVPDPNDPAGQKTVAAVAGQHYLLAGQRNSPIELTSLRGYGAGGAPDLDASPLEGGARGRRFTAVSFIGGNWVNPRGMVVIKPA